MLKTGISSVLSVFFVCCALSLPAFAQTDDDFITHTVEKGQGIYSIARMYGVAESEIISLNPGSESVIRVGQMLRIPKRKSDGLNFHTILSGETVYSLTRANRITEKDLYQANPGLEENGLKAGQTIVIPAPTVVEETQQKNDGDPVAAAREREKKSQYQAIHIVAKKETIYRISKKYGISQAEFLAANPQYRYSKLQVGSTVVIPYPEGKKGNSHTEEPTVIEPNPQEPVAETTPAPTKTDLLVSGNVRSVSVPRIIEAALLMPFELDGPNRQEQREMVEFYQGVLLAIDDMKRDGISVNLHVYDTGNESKSIVPILQNEKMKEMHVIFGPRHDNHINAVAEFSRENHIPLVLPINSNVDAVYSNPYVYQLNTPQSYQIADVCDNFFKEFRKPKLIILGTGGETRNMFLDQLKQELGAKGHPYVTVDATSINNSLTERLSTELDSERQNIFIISNNDVGKLSGLLPILQLVTRGKAREVETHLFGYPEYQMYASNHIEEFFEIDTWFYSWFYTNNQLPEAIRFNSDFRKAFGRQMMASYPSFASYGYDMAEFFLKAVSRYGTEFSSHLDRINVKPVQMGFKFQRASNWGGFINRKVFFVHLSNQYKVEKIDFDL